MEFEIRDGYPRADFEAAWEGHRRISFFPFGMFFGFLLYGVLVLRTVHALKLNSLVFEGAMMTYCVAWMVVSWLVAGFRCPRCGSRFYARFFGIGHNPFASGCGNCGLRKWECNPASYDLARLEDQDF